MGYKIKVCALTARTHDHQALRLCVSDIRRVWVLAAQTPLIIEPDSRVAAGSLSRNALISRFPRK